MIVGSGSDQNGIGTAFIWTASSGMQSLLSVLQQNGVHTADKWVQLTSLVGISADGTVMAGSGTSPKSKNFPFGKPEPFRVVLPAAK